MEETDKTVEINKGFQKIFDCISENGIKIEGKIIEYYTNQESHDYCKNTILYNLFGEVIKPLKEESYKTYVKCLPLVKNISKLFFTGIGLSTWVNYLNGEIKESILKMPERIQEIIDCILQDKSGELKLDKEGFLCSKFGRFQAKEIDFYKNPRNAENGWRDMLYIFLQDIIQPLETMYRSTYLVCLKKLEDIGDSIFPELALGIWVRFIKDMEKK